MNKENDDLDRHDQDMSDMSGMTLVICRYRILAAVAAEAVLADEISSLQQ